MLKPSFIGVKPYPEQLTRQQGQNANFAAHYGGEEPRQEFTIEIGTLVVAAVLFLSALGLGLFIFL
jgi:hypothetical protein